jgi:rhamnogalacturonan endolyase
MNIRGTFVQILSLLLAANGIAGATEGPAESEKPVTLSSDGDKVILGNGIVAATITPDATVSSLVFRGNETAQSIYYSMDGGKDYRRPGGGKFFVRTRTPDLVDVGYRNSGKDTPQHLDCEIHYVLKRGVPGVYTYAILTHPADYPDGGYGEWRLVWKHPPGLFGKIYVDGPRHWTLPTEEDFRLAKPTPIKEIVQLTSGPWAGRYDCKYDYAVSYHEAGCWGQTDEAGKVGQWIILGGYDYLNDGPTKQDLSAAHGYVLVHFGRNHYGGSTVRIPAGQSWEKIFGPVLLYCNGSEKGGEGCWEDARARVVVEKAAWPYAWMTGVPSYPPESRRGAVTGTFSVQDPLKHGFRAADTWIGLASPPAGGNWQSDSLGYQYWTKAGSGGDFTIPGIRPGTYTLYAFTDGQVGEFSRAGIHVTAGETNGLGSVVWEVPRRGKSIAWEIGVPDRTAGEFRHGMDPIRDYVWDHFHEEFPNPLEYTAGESDPARDWNYAHSWYRDGGMRVPWKWRIHFNLPEVPPTGDATLTMAFAGAHGRARVDVRVNDGAKPLGTVTPSVRGGNALFRDGNHAKYCVEYLRIPVASLRKGKNTITLEQPDTDAQSHVMYDYLSLELP